MAAFCILMFQYGLFDGQFFDKKLVKTSNSINFVKKRK